MLHFVFTGSESNVRHGRSIQQSPFRAREAVFDDVQRCVYPPSNPSNPPAILSQATSLAGTCYTFSLPVQKATLGTAGPCGPVRLFWTACSRLPAVQQLVIACL